MPKSKRAKVVPLSKVKKKGREWKSAIIERTRTLCDEYPDLYVFRYRNVRTECFKELREDMAEHSKFLMASTKKLQAALGRTREEEHRAGVHQLVPFLRGHAGLLLTRAPAAEVQAALEGFRHEDFARAGARATHTVELPEGPVTGPGGVPFPHTMEHTLRRHGLPTRLRKGVIELAAPHTVCKEGAKLTPHQAALLRHFGIKMAEARLQLVAALRGDPAELQEFEVSEDESEGEAGGDGDGALEDGLPASMMLPEVLPQR